MVSATIRVQVQQQQLSTMRHPTSHQFILNATIMKYIILITTFYIIVVSLA